MADMNENMKIALLIDAENVSHRYIQLVFDELVKFGTPTYKRIYGDWTNQDMVSWKNELIENALTPMQQYSYTSGKNSTDSALIIDAMDILYSGNVDGFCIVSSDSDFTKLILRLRESGMYVIGMGEQKTPKSIIKGCNKFTYLDLISEEAETEQEETKVSVGAPAKRKVKRLKIEREARQSLYRIVDELTEDSDSANIGTVNQRMQSLYPDFDYRNYGFKKFSELMKSLQEFEVEEVKIKGSNNGKNVSVRIRK